MKQLVLISLVLCTGCVTKTVLDDEERVSSFVITVNGVYRTDMSPRTRLPVTTVCAQKYNGEGNVPAEVRGTKDCPYIIRTSFRAAKWISTCRSERSTRAARTRPSPAR
jgi:hypothetical protein